MFYRPVLLGEIEYIGSMEIAILYSKILGDTCMIKGENCSFDILVATREMEELE